MTVTLTGTICLPASNQAQALLQLRRLSLPDLLDHELTLNDDGIEVHHVELSPGKPV